MFYKFANLIVFKITYQVWLYTCSAFGEIKQWWPRAVELIYQVILTPDDVTQNTPLVSEHSLAPRQ